MKKIFFAVCFLIAVLTVTAQTSYMFVDSMEGLRVRNNPGLKAEKIYLLPNNAKVEVIQRANEEINIDGVLGNWVLIKYNTTQGWVFSGYLVPNIEDSTNNWIDCVNYRPREKPYPMSVEERNYNNTTSAFEFIAKKLKAYFYPNVTTKDFYRSFYYPLAAYIPKHRSGVFYEMDLVIQQDNVSHYLKYNSERIKENGYVITVEQYRNNNLLKEMRFSVIFFNDYIQSPELISEDLEKRIRLIDLLDQDLALKISAAYILTGFYRAAEIKEGIFSKIIIEEFDFAKMMHTDYFEIYSKILEENSIDLTENEREILRQKLSSKILDYK
ncbi:MAG: SH3 domain-containing protein [Treponema sp.]|jgi:hypothetical protein|nr:SH3 domain-containing protein [Treponema sp.]